MQGGFNLEVGHGLFHSNFIVFAGYYQFQGDGTPTMYGLRLPADYCVNRDLILEGEYSRDNIRKNNYFIGARSSWRLGQSPDKLTLLQHKMTQMPVRDIDVITEAKKEESDCCS